MLFSGNTVDKSVYVQTSGVLSSVLLEWFSFNLCKSGFLRTFSCSIRATDFIGKFSFERIDVRLWHQSVGEESSGDPNLARNPYLHYYYSYPWYNEYSYL